MDRGNRLDKIRLAANALRDFPAARKPRLSSLEHEFTFDISIVTYTITPTQMFFLLEVEPATSLTRLLSVNLLLLRTTDVEACN